MHCNVRHLDNSSLRSTIPVFYNCDITGSISTIRTVTFNQMDNRPQKNDIRKLERSLYIYSHAYAARNYRQLSWNAFLRNLGTALEVHYTIQLVDPH